MKSLLTILTLVFTVMFSSTSYAEWTKVSEGVEGDVFYVDFERIRKHDGYVYFWALNDYLKPNERGDLSYKTYIQGDCKLFRFKFLVRSLHVQPMGRGTPSASSNKPQKDWTYPSPNTSVETILKKVCSR